MSDLSPFDNVVRLQTPIAAATVYGTNLRHLN